MYRVTRSGGWVAALAEPDYGGLVTCPPSDDSSEERELGDLGANTRLGRELSAGC